MTSREHSPGLDGEQKTSMEFSVRERELLARALALKIQQLKAAHEEVPKFCSVLADPMFGTAASWSAGKGVVALALVKEAIDGYAARLQVLQELHEASALPHGTRPSKPEALAAEITLAGTVSQRFYTEQQVDALFTDSDFEGL
jgi:hypothetical protein